MFLLEFPTNPWHHHAVWVSLLYCIKGFAAIAQSFVCVITDVETVSMIPLHVGASLQKTEQVVLHVLQSVPLCRTRKQNNIHLPRLAMKLLRSSL